MALFLNRLDVYEVFKPDLGGSWVEYNGASMPPTFSPAPTWKGGCDDPHNFFLDKCVRKRYKPRRSAVVWDGLGKVGQISVMLLSFMAVTLFISMFLARARKKRKRGESYMSFFFRDLTRNRKKKRKRGPKGMDDNLLDDKSRRSGKSRSSSSRKDRRSKSGGHRSRSRSRGEKSHSRSRGTRNEQSDSGEALGIATQHIFPGGLDTDNRQQLV